MGKYKLYLGEFLNKKEGNQSTSHTWWHLTTTNHMFAHSQFDGKLRVQCNLEFQQLSMPYERNIKFKLWHQDNGYNISFFGFLSFPIDISQRTNTKKTSLACFILSVWKLFSFFLQPCYKKQTDKNSSWLCSLKLDILISWSSHAGW